MRSAYNLAKSFGFAFSGVARSLRYERNLRIHFFAAAYVIYFSRYLGLSAAEFSVLLLSIGIVIACELVNTAVEAAVDLNTLAYNGFAKTAKDAAAGAVLVSAAVSLVIGVNFFRRPNALRAIWADVAAAPLVWAFLFAITLFLIAWPERRQIANGASKNNDVRKIE